MGSRFKASTFLPLDIEDFCKTSRSVLSSVLTNTNSGSEDFKACNGCVNKNVKWGDTNSKPTDLDSCHIVLCWWVKTDLEHNNIIRSRPAPVVKEKAAKVGPDKNCDIKPYQEQTLSGEPARKKWHENFSGENLFSNICSHDALQSCRTHRCMAEAGVIPKGRYTRNNNYLQQLRMSEHNGPNQWGAPITAACTCPKLNWKQWGKIIHIQPGLH